MCHSSLTCQLDIPNYVVWVTPSTHQALLDTTVTLGKELIVCLMRSLLSWNGLQIFVGLLLMSLSLHIVTTSYLIVRFQVKCRGVWLVSHCEHLNLLSLFREI